MANVITAGQLERFRAHLTARERSPGTVENYLRGVRAFAAWLDGAPVGARSAGEWKRALVEAYTEEFGEGPSAPPVTGYYNTLIAFKQCVEELGITGDPEKLQEERDAIANWFYNSPEIEGIQGTFSWVNGAMMTDPLMFRVENGEYVAVD